MPKRIMPTMTNTLIVLLLAAGLAIGCSESQSHDNDAAPPSEAELAKLGAQYYQVHACVKCHTTDGKKRLAPTFKGLYGKTETLADGSTIVVDDAYIHESILQPAAKVVDGFKPMHPPYTGRIDEQKVRALIAFIKTLK